MYKRQGLSLLGMLYTNYDNRKRHQEVRYQIPSEIQWDVNNRVHLYNKGLLAGGKASASYDLSLIHIYTNVSLARHPAGISLNTVAGAFFFSICSERVETSFNPVMDNASVKACLLYTSPP